MNTQPTRNESGVRTTYTDGSTELFLGTTIEEVRFFLECTGCMAYEVESYNTVIEEIE